jgi:hypothetical protein
MNTLPIACSQVVATAVPFVTTFTPSSAPRLRAALYLPNTGKQASDLIAGVTPAKPAEVAAHLLKPGVNTLAF